MFKKKKKTAGILPTLLSIDEFAEKKKKNSYCFRSELCRIGVFMENRILYINFGTEIIITVHCDVGCYAEQ